jgi:hypothetical protein
MPAPILRRPGRPARRSKPVPPSDRDRNRVRRTHTGTPAEWAQLAHLAARLAEGTGYAPNESGAIHRAVHALLDADAEGLLSIEDGRIRAHRRRTMPD